MKKSILCIACCFASVAYAENCQLNNRKVNCKVSSFSADDGRGTTYTDTIIVKSKKYKVVSYTPNMGEGTKTTIDGKPAKMHSKGTLTCVKATTLEICYVEGPDPAF